MKEKNSRIFIGGSVFSALPLLEGCSRVLLLAPKGPVAAAERFVILAAFGLMLIVVIPVVGMVFLFPWKYRAANANAAYAPKWSRSGKIERIIWLVPAVIVTVLGVLIWEATRQLDPYKPIVTGVAPIRIEAVSLDWKWLFIYPDQHIATVNRLVFPAQVPLSFRLTSATVMTSFFIPQLGSQIYAMAGMQTRLHLMADEPGVFAGQNQQFSGRGYADMTFKAIAVSREQFDAWVQTVGKSPEILDPDRLKDLEKPGVGYPVATFSLVYPDLFDHILGRYDKTMDMKAGDANGESGSMQMKTGAPEGK